MHLCTLSQLILPDAEIEEDLVLTFFLAIYVSSDLNRDWIAVPLAMFWFPFFSAPARQILLCRTIPN